MDHIYCDEKDKTSIEINFQWNKSKHDLLFVDCICIFNSGNLIEFSWLNGPWNEICVLNFYGKKKVVMKTYNVPSAAICSRRKDPKYIWPHIVLKFN